MTEEQHQFIEDLGQHMTTWGLPRTTGRIYGYLLLRMEPASLDEIGNALEMAKSGASVAARQLVALGLARSRSQPGSRRVLFEALYSLEAIFVARNSQVIELLARLRQGARVAPAGPGRRQLEEMADMLQDFLNLGPELLRQLRERERSRT